MQIKCTDDHAERMINILDIYYIESVDKKTFVYLENGVYRTDFRLYQLKNKLQTYGFVQISKSCILNINILDNIRPPYLVKSFFLIFQGFFSYISQMNEPR